MAVLNRRCASLIAALWVITLFLLPGSHAGACTPVSGIMLVNTEWTLAESPYCVTDSVAVAAGVTLTIEPGVIVKFTPGRALRIDGTLIARGTASSFITFTSDQNAPSPGDWGYILFNDSSADGVFDSTGGYTDGSILEYSVVEYAGGEDIDDNGAVRMNNAHPFIHKNVIRYNAASGIHGWNLSAMLRIHGNTIHGNSTVDSSQNGGGIRVSRGSASIRDNNIYNNDGYYSGGGIHVDDCDTDIVNNTLTSNRARMGGGLYIWSSDNTIVNNIFQYNEASDIYGSSGYGGGIRVQTGKANIHNNVFFRNSSVGQDGAISLNSSVVIERNSFVANAAKDAAVLTLPGTTSCAYNTVTGNTSDGPLPNCSIKVGTWSISRGVVNNNNIFDNDTDFALCNNNAEGTADIDATMNWWGTAVGGDVEDLVYHFVDDSSLGYVNYIPYRGEIGTDAPISPPVDLITTAQCGDVGDSIVLNWTANTEADAAGYNVYIDSDPGHPYEGVHRINDPANTTYSPGGFTAGTYYIAATAFDSDADGASDLFEGHESWYSNEVRITFEDPDGDGVPQVTLGDSDRDGISDDGDLTCDPVDNPCSTGITEKCDDNCPDTPNPDQADTDGDGIGDACDNCREVKNRDQRDSNYPEDDNTRITGDQHYGDACDADYSNNGFVGLEDFNVLRTCFGKSAAVGCEDIDCSGNGFIGLEDFNCLRTYYGKAPGPGIE